MIMVKHQSLFRANFKRRFESADISDLLVTLTKSYLSIDYLLCDDMATKNDLLGEDMENIRRDWKYEYEAI